jgi:ubiquitin domain-containing protein
MSIEQETGPDKKSDEKKPKDKVEVEVRTPDGGRVELKAKLTDTVGELKDRAITALGVQPAPGVVFFLFLGGARLADLMTLSAAGVRDETVLVLASEPQVGAR